MPGSAQNSNRTGSVDQTDSPCGCAAVGSENNNPLAKQMQLDTAILSSASSRRSSHRAPGSKNALSITGNSDSRLNTNENTLASSRIMGPPRFWQYFIPGIC